MPRELEMPDILKEDADVIHNRMLKNAPEDINLVEGDFFWDATRPAAEEKAELVQVKLQHILRLAFPQTSYGQYLEFLGEMKGVFRHEPVKASGYIKIIGKPRTYIPDGTSVFTIATDKHSSIEFVTKIPVAIGETGEILAKIECIQPGAVGNVARDTIKLLGKSINGIEAITNEDPITGGIEQEDDENFRKRVLESYDEPLSGAKKDYVKWGKEVPGVGAIYVVPVWNGGGTVKVLVIDANGQPANENLIKAVQQHIAPDSNKGGGLAPIGANVTVEAPETLPINISVKLMLEDGYDIDLILINIKNNLIKYLSTIKLNTGNEEIEYISIAVIGHAILSVKGAKDYQELKINGGTDPIPVSIGTVPILGVVDAI